MRYVVLLALVIAFTSSAKAQTDSQGIETLTVRITDSASLMFLKVSPGEYKLDYPDFHVLETEVTNCQFKQYLEATGGEKDDTEVARIVARRRESRVFSSAEIPYSVEDESAIWRSNTFPRGMAEHPVTIVTLHDAENFAKWIDANYSKGIVRLPTWNEWMIAAYGSDRSYPWGNTWNSENLHSSHGQRITFSNEDKTPKRTEAVKARPKGRTPEGVWGMLGNAGEYICAGDPTNKNYFNLGSRSMGGGFTDGVTYLEDDAKKGMPRGDYWGYSHYAIQRQCDLGFRLVIVPEDKNNSMLVHGRLFDQNNKSWMKTDDESLSAPDN